MRVGGRVGAGEGDGEREQDLRRVFFGRPFRCTHFYISIPVLDLNVACYISGYQFNSGVTQDPRVSH